MPGGYLAITGQTITAAQHNSPLQDLAADANAARPIASGGTGATTAAEARTNLGVADLSDLTVTPTGGNTSSTLKAVLGDRLTARSRNIIPAAAAGDIRASLSAALAAMADGDTLYIPPGTYWINSADTVNRAVQLVAAKSIRIDCAPGAIFKAGANLNAALSGSGGRSVFRFDSGLSEASEHRIEWIGGKLDLSLLPSAAGAGVDGFSTLRVNPFFTRTTVDHGVQAASGANLGTGGGDSSWFAKEYLQAAWVDCASLGAPDLAIYPSGDAGKLCRGGAITRLRAYRCGAAVGVKRNAETLTITDPDWLECGSGLFTGQTELLDDHGQGITILGGSIVRTQGDPIRLENTSRCTVSGVRIIDYGRWVSDGTTITSVSALNRFAGVKLLGAKHCAVTGSTIGFEDWTAPNGTEREAYAVRLGGYTTSAAAVVTAEGNIIDGNVFRSAFGGYLADANTASNLLGRAARTGIANPDIVLGTGNRRVGVQAITPNLAGSVSNLAGAAYDLREGMIHHEGDTVTVQVYIDINALTNLSGTVTITATRLPTAASRLTQYQGTLIGSGITGTSFACAIDAGASAIQLFVLGSGTRTALQHTDFTSSARIGVSITYEVA